MKVMWRSQGTVADKYNVRLFALIIVHEWSTNAIFKDQEKLERNHMRLGDNGHIDNS